MRRACTGAVVACIALLAGGTAHAHSGAPYKTDNQAEKYLENKFPRWAGMNLLNADFKFALCLGSPLFNSRTNRFGEDIYRHFSCTLSAGGRSFNLKVHTLPGGRWLVQAGRFNS
jgi:hypothetical protein